MYCEAELFLSLTHTHTHNGSEKNPIHNFLSLLRDRKTLPMILYLAEMGIWSWTVKKISFEYYICWQQLQLISDLLTLTELCSKITISGWEGSRTVWIYSRPSLYVSHTINTSLQSTVTTSLQRRASSFSLIITLSLHIPSSTLS